MFKKHCTFSNCILAKNTLIEINFLLQAHDLLLFNLQGHAVSKPDFEPSTLTTLVPND